MHVSRVPWAPLGVVIILLFIVMGMSNLKVPIGWWFNLRGGGGGGGELGLYVI